MFRLFVHIKVRLPVRLISTLVTLKQFFKGVGTVHMVPQTCLVGTKVTKLTVLVPGASGTPRDAIVLLFVVFPARLESPQYMYETIYTCVDIIRLHRQVGS